MIPIQESDDHADNDEEDIELLSSLSEESLSPDDNDTNEEVSTSSGGSCYGLHLWNKYRKI